MADGLNSAINAEAKRIEEDCIHTGKGNLNSADTLNKRHYWLGVPATIAAALAGADIFVDTNFSGSLAAIAAALIAASTFINPSKRASEHQVAGNQYLSLAKRTRRFREIDLGNMADEETRAVLEELSDIRDGLNETSPIPLPKAVEKARKGIDAGEATYVVDKGD